MCFLLCVEMCYGNFSRGDARAAAVVLKRSFAFKGRYLNYYGYITEFNLFS